MKLSRPLLVQYNNPHIVSLHVKLHQLLVGAENVHIFEWTSFLHPPRAGVVFPSKEFNKLKIHKKCKKKTFSSSFAIHSLWKWRILSLNLGYLKCAAASSKVLKSDFRFRSLIFIILPRLASPLLLFFFLFLPVVRRIKFWKVFLSLSNTQVSFSPILSRKSEVKCKAIFKFSL